MYLAGWGLIETMQCVKCGREIMDGAAFCPYCGQKATAGGQETEKPLYQAEVKRPLKPAGRLIVYPDRTEFVASSVQKATFTYTGLVSVKKGMLDTIEFITEDGRTESCPADRKCVHEALVYIEQASQPYRAQRKKRLLAEGIRYSFPSNQGLMNSGVLNLSAEKAEFVAKSGKNELVSYREVKFVTASGGMLTFSLFGGGSKAFAVPKELLEEVTAFVSGAVAPLLAERKEALLAQGIYFSSDCPDGGTLDIFADRAEQKSRAGKAEGCVPFEKVRAVSLRSGTLEFAMTDGSLKLFSVEEYLAADILAFVQKAVEPYITARTAGFDISFGADERIEFNDERGVFHLIRQGGREITDERPTASLVRCELAEDKKLTALGSVVSGGIGMIKSAAKAAAEEKIGGMAATLTIRTDGGEESERVYFARSSVGMARTDKKYVQCLADWEGLLEYLKGRCPECAAAPFTLPQPEAAPLESEKGAGASPAEDAAGDENAPAAQDAARRDDLGIFKYLDGVSRFVESCPTPMTIALGGNRGSGKSSVLGMLFDQMSAAGGKNLFWLNARPLARGETAEALSELAGRALIGLLSGSGGASNQAGNFITELAGLATGIIAGDTAIGKEIAGGVLNKNAAAPQADLAAVFAKQVEQKTPGANEKAVFLIDGLDQLAPAKAVDLLEAMRDFFECPGCVFVVAANYRDILAGARERYDEAKAKAFFDGMFKMSFRVPASSINVKSYAKGKLEELGLTLLDDAELDLWAALILSSTGKNVDAMDRLFVSFHLLKDMAGQEVCEDRYKRLALFALLCMQTRFHDAYEYAVRQREQVTPEFLAGLCGGAAQPWNKDQAGEEAAAYRDFGAVLAQIVNLDDRAEISSEECRSFAAVLELSCITSR